MIIHLQTSRWRPGQRLALGGATAALVAAVAWASLGERGGSVRAVPRAIVSAPIEGVGPTAPLDRQGPVRAAARAPAPASVDTDGSVPATPPFRYVGHWKEHGATTVVLSDRGRNLLVRVPGVFDDRYHILAVDEHRLVVKVMPLGTVQTLTLSPGAPWTMSPTARVASPTAVAAVPVPTPEPEPSWARTSVRRKAGDAESSMETPGLPVASAIGAAPSATPADAEPDN